MTGLCSGSEAAKVSGDVESREDGVAAVAGPGSSQHEHDEHHFAFGCSIDRLVGCGQHGGSVVGCASPCVLPLCACFLRFGFVCMLTLCRRDASWRWLRFV
eukprot:3024370-Prymnesium_polylepis.2